MFFPLIASLQAQQRARAPTASLPPPPLHAAAGLAGGCGGAPREAYLCPQATLFALAPALAPAPAPAPAPTPSPAPAPAPTASS